MKNILSRFAVLVALCVYLSGAAQYPANYYAAIDGKSGEELKAALCGIISNLTIPKGANVADPYASRYSNLPGFFKTTDVRPGITPQVWWDMYSDMLVETSIQFGTYMNREHSFPKSWWQNYKLTTAYVDLFQLYPGEAKANTAKGNYPLGEVSMVDNVYFDNGVSKVGYPVTGQGGNAKMVFEPADEYKGDFARTYLYMVTCYPDLQWTPSYTYMIDVNSYLRLKPWAINMLLKWHRNDPVDVDKEVPRNEEVYKIQNNRNPFIDIPELVEYIWGSKAGEVFRLSNVVNPDGAPELITPVQGMALDFSQVAVGQSVKAQLFFRGENIKNDLNLKIYNGDTDMFSIPSTSLAAKYVSQSTGTTLEVTYTPTSVGRHQATLLISGGGITGSRGVTLIGEAFDVPVLGTCTALNASDITSDSYRANWTTPSSDIVDYWVINRTKYVGGEQLFEEVMAEESGWIIEDFDQSDYESYTVQSVRLGYKSTESNIVYVNHLGINGVTVDLPLVVIGYDGCMRFNCSSPHTGGRIFDISGKLVTEIPTVRQNLVIDLPAGIYLVTTDQCSRPLKVVVR